MSAPSSAPPFLAGAGEIAELIAAFGWGATPLGPIGSWPAETRAAVGLIVRSRVPMATLWGPGGVMIYNAGYAAIAGGRHPGILGRGVRDAWPEVAAFNDRVLRTGLAGETLSFRDQEMTLNRSGAPEQVRLDLDYSAILDADGAPAAVLAVVVETTAKMQAERRLAAAIDALASLNADLERRVAERTAERDRVWRNSRDLLAVIDADDVFRAANPAWKTILGLKPEDVIGRGLRDFIWPADAEAAQGGLAGRESRFRHADGSPRWISWQTFVEGAVVHACGRDVTAEKRQAEALREAEERLRQAAETPPGGS